MAHGDIEVTIFGGVDLSDSLIELSKFWDYNLMAEVQ
jgi:hypothetical protein